MKLLEKIIVSKKQGKNIYTEETKKKHKTLVTIISIILVIIWLYLLYMFKKTLINFNYKTLMIIMIIMPIISILYHRETTHYYLNKVTTYDYEKKKILENIENKTQMAKLIPVAIFGFAMLLSRVKDKKLIDIAFPYLVLGLFLGTIIPLNILQINFENSSLEKLILSEVIDFGSEAMSFGLMTTGFLLPFLYLAK